MKKIYKAIIIDYDDCLVIHNNINGNKLNPFHFDNVRAEHLFLPIGKSLKMFENSRLNIKLLKFIRLASDENTKIMVLTEASSKLLEIKKQFVESRNIYDYINTDYIHFVSNSSLDVKKADIIKSFIEYNNITPDDTLFIDDYLNNLKDASSINIDVMPPQNVDIMLEQYEEKPIPTKRLNHMIGVAEYMYNNAEKYGLDKEEAYLVGLVHDIGYLFGKENHENNGAKLISKAFNFSNPKGVYSDSLKAIDIHNYTPKEYFSSSLLNKFNEEEKEKLQLKNKMLFLLWEADMSIDSTGEIVGFDKRLADIDARYGENSEPYQTSKQVINWLKENKE